MTAVRAVPVEERRARLARRHGLASGASSTSVAGAAERLVGIHATDPVTVFLSTRARVPGFTVAALETAMYERREVLRHMGMRRTMFVLPSRLVPVVQRACSDEVAVKMRRKLVAEIEAAGVVRPAGPWIDAVFAEVRAVIEATGPATGAQLAAAVPLLRTKLPGRDAEVALTTRLLTLMATEAGLVRGRPVGSWVSTQHRWALPGVDHLAAAPSAAEALVLLVERWLRAFGPAPVADLVWWTGLGATKVRRALAALDTVEVALDGGTGVLLADDVDPEPAVDPWVALLPSLDSTPMGWKQRDWFVGAHAGVLFDTSGNIGPTAWVDGRIVGGWAVRRGGEVVVRSFEDVGRDAAAALEAAAAGLTTWLDGTAVSPRFPTPIDRELRA